MDMTGSLVGLVGLVAVIVGLWWAWPPLALIMGGLVLLAGAAAIERPADRGRTETDSASTEWGGGY